MKICFQCKERLELHAFPKRKEAPDGHRGVCSQCRSKNALRYYYNNKEKVLAINRKYSISLKGQNAKRSWRNANKHKIKSYQRKYNSKEEVKQHKALKVTSDLIKKQNQYKRAWERKNSSNVEYVARLKIRKHTNYLIRRGQLVRQVCQIKTCTKPGEAHHANYNQPNLIQWLCRQHHHAWHRVFKTEELEAWRPKV